MAERELKILYTADQIATRIAELRADITQHYEGKELLVVGILKGSFMFMADLVRAVKLPLMVDFMGLSSYGNKTETSGVVKITNDLSTAIEGKHVLIVEDIVDTGLTMAYLLDLLHTRHPASVQICTLLEKPDNARTKIDVAYKGFVIPNHFVIGYGLDDAGMHRNLPYIGWYP